MPSRSCTVSVLCAIACIGLTTSASASARAASGPPGFLTPSLILDEGSIGRYGWQAGVRLIDGERCFWIRIRDRRAEIPGERCALSLGYLQFAAFPRATSPPGSVHLIVAPVEARSVRLDLRGQRHRTIELKRPRRIDGRTRLKGDFRYAAETYSRRSCVVSETFYDANGVVLDEQTFSTCGVAR